MENISLTECSSGTIQKLQLEVTTTIELIKLSTKKVTFSWYRPGVAESVGRGIVLLFHDRNTRRERPGTHCIGGWVGPRAGLDGLKISSPSGFDPGPSST